LKSEFPEMSGFSRTNLFAIKKFYSFYYQEFFKSHSIVESELIPQVGGQLQTEIIPQVGGLSDNVSKCLQIPWKHNLLIIEKTKDNKEVIFYINQTIENNWSRAVLEYQIESNLYQRAGSSVTNFKNTLPEIQSDLANELLKDPYNFEFLTLSSQAKERDLEQKLVQNISKFLLELGKGFAYLGNQYLLKVGTKEYRTDLLFYHTKLKCYVVIELKLKEFEPEFIGKLNFYITAVNELVKDKSDLPTIGILLCKTKDNFEVEFALKDINKPIGVSEFNYTELPENIKKELPTLEQFENELKKFEND
jgi:predicted nuclease of restriction endonuclease-like (RecB) superfamily